MVRLEEGKADLEARKVEPPKEPQRTQEPPADPFEAAIAQSAPKAQEWLRAHPEYVTNQKLSLKAAAAHNDALAEGLTANSDEYFDHCERFLGLKKDEGNGAAKPAPQPRTRTMPAAPVSREGASMNGELTPSQVKLSPGEQRAAVDGSVTWSYSDPKTGAIKGEPVGLKEYARRKMIMQKEGHYDRSFTDN